MNGSTGTIQGIGTTLPIDLETGGTGSVTLVNSLLVITNNLKRSGLFAPIDQAAYLEKISNIDVPPQFKSWASINAQAANQDTPWLLAGALGRTAMLRHMLPKGPDFTIRNRFGGNALIPACERAHVDTVAFLVTTPIDVNHINNLGWTCLLEIVILGDGGPRHVEVTKLVLAAGANPNIADKDGASPLRHARKRNQREVAALIEAAGGR